MDGLARSLGLDIEALALELALSDGTPPTQCLPVKVDDETMEEACTKKDNIQASKESHLEKVRNILMKAKSTQYSPVIKTKGTQCSPVITKKKCSPIITPKVIRPVCSDSAPASNVSSAISKMSKAQPKNPFKPLFGANPNQQSGQNITKETIH